MCKQNVGQWLRQRMEKAGYSENGLAQLAGISRRTVVRIVNGGRVTRRTAKALATPLRIPPAAVDALARPGITAAELDALAGIVKGVILWTALDLASLAFKVAAGG